MKVGFITDLSFTDDTKLYPMMSQALDTVGAGHKHVTLLSMYGDRMVDRFGYTRGVDNVLFKPSYVLDKRIPMTERNAFLTYIHLIENCDRVVFFEKKETPSNFLDGVKEATKKRTIPIMVLSV